MACRENFTESITLFLAENGVKGAGDVIDQFIPGPGEPVGFRQAEQFGGLDFINDAPTGEQRQLQNDIPLALLFGEQPSLIVVPGFIQRPGVEVFGISTLVS